MAILNVLPVSMGHAGIKPRIVYIQTDDSTATVLTAGYLSDATKTFQFTNEDLAVVSVVDSGTTGVGIFEVIVSGSTVSLEAPINPGNVTLPVIDDHIAVFDGTTGKIKDDATIAINGGSLQAGLSGTAGFLSSFPGTAAKGSLRVTAADNTGDTLVTISNAQHGQASVYVIPDVGEAAGSFLVSTLDAADTNSNIVTFDVTVGQGDLASAGTVTLQASSGTKQYKIRELYINSGGTDFSGGGGDRLATISDGTTDYSVIPAASLQTLVNGRWGDTTLAFPASAAINVSSAAGTAITIAYSGGSADYSAGSVVISGVMERVA